MPQLRINLTQAEYDDLVDRSLKIGSPSVNAYARQLLCPSVNNVELLKGVIEAIGELPSGAEFRLRDLQGVPGPAPARFGRYIFENQKDLGVTFKRKDRQGVNVWEKQ